MGTYPRASNRTFFPNREGLDCFSHSLSDSHSHSCVVIWRFQAGDGGFKSCAEKPCAQLVALVAVVVAVVVVGSIIVLGVARSSGGG